MKFLLYHIMVWQLYSDYWTSFSLYFVYTANFVGEMIYEIILTKSLIPQVASKQPTIGRTDTHTVFRCVAVNYDNILSSTSDLQPSTAIANQLPGQLVSIKISTRGPNCFKFIIALIMPSRNII